MKRIILSCLVALATALTVSAQVPYLTLNNGLKMPQLGLGTFSQTNDQAYAGVLHALQHGYRHIDTAHAYYDEEGVGRAIKDSGVPREEIWVTSKLWIDDYSDGKTLQHIDENFDVFDFALSSADMARIRGINKEDPFFKMGPPPADFGRN